METFDTAKYGTIDRDVTYCTQDGLAQAMDIYYPPSGGPWSGLIFVHGGGWAEGDKAPLPVNPAGAGYLVASINYRMYPAYRFPAMIEDVKCAIRYLRAHAAAYNLDPDRIALIGHSAGGHLAALAGLAGESAGWDTGPYLEQSSRVQAVVVMSGPTDLTREFPDWVMAQKTQCLRRGAVGQRQPGQLRPPQSAALLDRPRRCRPGRAGGAGPSSLRCPRQSRRAGRKADPAQRRPRPGAIGRDDDSFG